MRGKSSFFEGLCKFREILQISNVPENHKLMRHAVLAHLENSVLKFSLGKPLLDNLQWQEFLRKYRVANSGVDKEGIILYAAYQYLERNLVILTPTVTLTFKGGPSADRKPSIVMAATGDQPTNQEFWPVFQTGYYPMHPFPSHWVARNDTKYITREEMQNMMKSYVIRPSETKMVGRVLGYMSKVITESDRSHSIW